MLELVFAVYFLLTARYDEALPARIMARRVASFPIEYLRCFGRKVFDFWEDVCLHFLCDLWIQSVVIKWGGVIN